MDSNLILTKTISSLFGWPFRIMLPYTVVAVTANISDCRQTSNQIIMYSHVSLVSFVK